MIYFFLIIHPICRFRTKDYNIGFGLRYEGEKERAEIKSVEKVESQVIVQDQYIADKPGISCSVST